MPYTARPLQRPGVMSFNLDASESKLKSIVEPLENGNYKKALQEANKLLKKSPDCAAAKALKAFTLHLSGKIEDAYAISQEIINNFSVDESTVNIVMSYFLKTGQTNNVESFLAKALKRCPNREDLLVYSFIHQAQEGDYSSQQATARLLSQHFPSSTYMFWVIMSTLMQAESNKEMAERMYFPLAEKMLMREAKNGNMIKHGQFGLLIQLLMQQRKYEDVLQILNEKDIMDRLYNEDYYRDYSPVKLKCLAHLCRWDDAFELGVTQIKSDPDDWSPWKYLIELSVIDKDTNVIQLRIQQLMSFIESCIVDHPRCRGPQLARLDLIANMLMTNVNTVDHNQILAHLFDYFNAFSSKPICAMDLAYVVHMVITNKSELIKFVESLLKTADTDVGLNHSGVIYRHLCAYQIARANDYVIDLQTILSVYFHHAPERSAILCKQLADISLEDGKTSLDLYPVDGFAVLALSNLMETPVPKDVTNKNTFNLGIGLLAIHWIERIGLLHTVVNHHLRLRLCKLWSVNFLNCPNLIIQQLDKLRIRQLLYISLGYILITPNPLISMGPSLSPTDVGQTDFQLLSLYRRVRALGDTMITEAKDCLAGSYRKHALAKIHEFTQFIDRLHHADSLLTVRIELLYWHFVTAPNNFDTLLEVIGLTTSLDRLVSRLKNMVDCRDFKVTPDFDPYTKLDNSAELSAIHLKVWLNLRCLTMDLLRNASTVVMGIVHMQERLMKTNENGANLTKTDKTSIALNKLDTLLQLLSDEAIQNELPDGITFNESCSLLSSIVFNPENVFKSSVGLPTLNAATFHLQGPFKNLLSTGIQAIISTHRVLNQNNVSNDDESIFETLATFGNTFCTDTCSGVHLCPFNCAIIPSPPSNLLDTTTTNSLLTSDIINPGSVLQLISLVYESITVGTLIISMLHCCLRPRSHHHLQMNKRQKKKSTKANQQNSTTTTTTTTTTTVNSLHNENDATSNTSPVCLFLDKIGASLHSITKKFLTIACDLNKLAESWSHWSKDASKDLFVKLSTDVCFSLLEKEYLDENPVLVPSSMTSTYHDIADSYARNFNAAATVFKLRAHNLRQILNELVVYDATAV